MAAVLFLAPADLGATVLATGALAHALGEDPGMATLCVTPEAQPLFRAVPAMHVFMPWSDGFSFAVVARLRGLKFDTVVDARGGVAGRLIPTKSLVRVQPSPMLRHLSEAWGEAAGAEKALAPKLWVDAAARETAAALAPGAGPLLALAPGGVDAVKRWPAERFAATARRLTTGPLRDAAVIVLGAAARDAEITRTIVTSLDADGVPARDLGKEVDLLAAAALLERATLCIGNDNALTHIAAAMGAPTLTLFGPTDERVRAPYGPRTATLRARPLEEFAALPPLDAEAAMGEISIDAVEQAALDLLHAGGLR